MIPVNTHIHNAIQSLGAIGIPSIALMRLSGALGV